MDWNKFPFRVYSIEMPFHKKFYVFWNSQKNNYGTIQSVKSTASRKLMIGNGLVMYICYHLQDDWKVVQKHHFGSTSWCHNSGCTGRWQIWMQLQMWWYQRLSRWWLLISEMNFLRERITSMGFFFHSILYFFARTI